MTRWLSGDDIAPVSESLAAGGRGPAAVVPPAATEPARADRTHGWRRPSDAVVS
jgi:hypothetical protein